MPSTNSENIEVRSSTLNNLVADVANGRYRIPQFQREFVWKRPKVIKLFDSIYKEFPIGSFFVWRAGREHNDLFRHAVELDIPPVRRDDDVAFILDGQQRIASLYVTLRGMQVRGTDYSKICFDLQDEKFVFLSRGPDNRRYVAVCDVWGPKAVSLMPMVEETNVGALERLYRILKTYPISIVEVRDKDLPAACNIFQRINQAGQRLDRFDLVSAMTFAKDFDLREHLSDDIQVPLEQKGFGKISPVVVTQLMALLRYGACTERNEYALKSGDVKTMWNDVVQAVLLAADTLRKHLGVMKTDFLPYDALMTLLAYLYVKSPGRSLTADQMQWASRWFWRASFGEYYGSGGPTKMGRDREVLDQLAVGAVPDFQTPVTITIERLVGTRMTWSRSAIRNAFLCLLATRNPLHLVNNSPLNLADGSISDFTSTERHHIFPHAFLRETGYDGSLVHALPNFCFLPSELNKYICGRKPSEYFEEFRAKNPGFGSAAKTHLIPVGNESGIAQDDYLAFLHARAKLVLDEIGRACGRITTPREDERQAAIEAIERRIRDRIDAVLQQAYGEAYWRTAVPEAVRLDAEKRIQGDLDSDPGLRKDRFGSSRARLDYCTLMDYVPIIVNKGNWSFFESLFRRKEDVQQHMKALSDYRNAVMHVREMTEFVRLGGDRAMIWLESILAFEPEPETMAEEAE
jgi:hypothetical protein